MTKTGFDPLGKAEHDPEFLALEAAIATENVMLAAVEATENGLPALAAIDAMLTALFTRYRNREPYTLANAGFIVARHMRLRGYVEIGKAKCPPGCSASRAAMFRLPTPIRSGGN